MFKFAFIASLCIFLIACNETEKSNSKEKAVEEVDSERPLIVEEDGRYTEWYPGHEQIKKKGKKDDKGRRTGVWKLYSPDGVELSVTVYKEGKKDGHIVVKHPTGAVHYSGEYSMDEPVGKWKFYNDQGQLVNRKFYDEE
ncbi:MAG: hypothetical protein WED10_09280 [Brumimicrobium sp.]